MKNTLDTSNDLYLVDFYAKSSAVIFKGCDSGTLGDLIQQNGNSGIIAIRRYNPAKCRFEKQSIKTVKQLFSWDTHSTEQLKRVNYIK